MKNLCTLSILMIALYSCNTKPVDIDIEKEKEIAVAEALKKIEDDRQYKLDVIEKFYGVFETGDMSVLSKILAANYTQYPSDPGQTPDIDGMKQHMEMFGSMFSNLSGTKTHILVDKDLVQVRGEWEVTHSGDAFGIPKSGKRIKFTAFDLHHFNADGKIDITWHLEDYWGMYTQMTAE